jgi:hypothetical protein
LGRCGLCLPKSVGELEGRVRDGGMVKVRVRVRVRVRLRSRACEEGGEVGQPLVEAAELNHEGVIADAHRIHEARLCCLVTHLPNMGGGRRWDDLPIMGM